KRPSCVKSSASRSSPTPLLILMLRYWKTNRSSPRHAIRERDGGRSTAARSALATKKRIRAAATAPAARGRNIRERADASRRRKTALAPARRAEVKRGAADNRPAARGPVQHPDAFPWR